MKILRFTSFALRVYVSRNPLNQNKLTSTLFLTVWLLGITLLLTTGCRAFLPSPPPPAPVLPTPTPTPRLQFTVGPLSTDLGRETLDSYRANLRLEFAGMLEEKTVAGQIEALTEVVAQPSARHFYLNVTGTPPRNLPGGISEVFQRDNALYFKKASDAAWSQFMADESAIDRLNLFDPERLLVIPATVSQPPQPETLRERSVEHYRFNELDLTAPAITFEKAEGDLWLTTPDNVLLQYTLSATVRMPLADPAIRLFETGQLTLTYDLSDINAPLEITLPEVIQGERNELATLPQLPDAQIVTAFPSLLEYTSVISAISATLFYREQLNALDWAEDNAEIFNEKANLTFSKEDQTLSLIIAPTEDSQKIKVLLSLDEP